MVYKQYEKALVSSLKMSAWTWIKYLKVCIYIDTEWKDIFYICASEMRKLYTPNGWILMNT